MTVPGASRVRVEAETTDKLTLGFDHCDIGTPKISGSARLVESGWDVVAGGVDIWETGDQFHFVFKAMTGDFDVAVRVASFTPAHLYSKAGLMIRETLTAESAHLMLVVFADDQPRNNNLGAYEMQFRAKDGVQCQAIYPAVLPPAPPEFPASYPNTWLRVARRDNLFTAYGSSDGKSWRLYAQYELPLSKTVSVGPALTSHNAEHEAKALFRDYTEFNHQV
ncbi:MAG: hypothetical protein WCI02_14805 [Planctomycetota bacterium]|jgi:hypothetical protein